MGNTLLVGFLLLFILGTVACLTLLTYRLIHVERALVATLDLMMSTLTVLGSQPEQELPPELQRFVNSQRGTRNG